MTKKITEMDRLINMLMHWEIPFDLTDDVCGNTFNQLWYPSKEDNICDVICHEYSYSHENHIFQQDDEQLQQPHKNIYQSLNS